MADDDRDAEPDEADSTFDEFDDELYDEVKRIAAKFKLRGPNPTIGATVLVHEAFIRLRKKRRTVSSRQHLLALFVIAARRAAIDEIRKRVARKRLMDRVDVNVDAVGTRDPSVEMLAAVSEAFDALEREDPTMAAAFAAQDFGMTVADIASEFELPIRTVERMLHFARGWMKERIRGRGRRDQTVE